MTADGMPPLRVELGERSYEIHVGIGALSLAGALIRSDVGERGIIVTHPSVDRLHGEALRTGLGCFAGETVLVPSGERQKSLRRAKLLWDELLSRGADRRSVILAFGGGVIGDLAGFVTATYMRGLPYVQVPTTLLAQVDASVGGKVAINHPRVKNLIGAFYQPRLVLADVSTLATLRPRDYREGLAEVVKHAVIADAGLFSWLEQNYRAVLKRDPDTLAYLVRRNCEIKAEVVQADERESGLRAVLNFGHTFAHALESLTEYRRLRHGEAVSIGMCASARVAQRLSMISESDRQRLVNLLSVLRLPIRIPAAPASAILDAIRSDKKALARSPRFVLPTGIGHVEIGCEVPESLLREVLTEVRVVN
jgi:3-dehydroquinate synthase